MMVSDILRWFSRNQDRLVFLAALFLTPLFYVVAFPPIDVSEAAFIWLTPFAVWLSRGPSLRKVGLTALAIGWISWLALIFWLHHVTWLGLILLAGAMGAYFAAWAVGVAWLSRRTRGQGLFSGLPLTIGAAALWVVVEWIRGWFLTGFPWLPLAATQWSQPMMLQSAAYFGSWSISFFLVALNFGVAGYLLQLVDFAKTRKRRICPEFYLSLSLVVALSFMLLRVASGQQREQAFRAGVVQPDVPQDEKWDDAFARNILSQLEFQTGSLRSLKPDAVFWPESVLPYPVNDDGLLEGWASRLAGASGAPIFAGSLGIEPGEGDEETSWYNSVFLVRPEYGLYPKYYSKRHLVPFGEYVPFRRFWPWIEKIVPIDGDILPGGGAVLLPLDLEDRTIRIGSLICYEDVFPGLARASVLDGAGALFVATNSAWYGRTGASTQHMAHSVLRAIETRRVILRVGNDGWTGWIDEYGNVMDSLTPWEQEWTVWDVTRDRRWIGQITPYVKNGDWLVALCAGMVLACWGWAWRRIRSA